METHYSSPRSTNFPPISPASKTRKFPVTPNSVSSVSSSGNPKPKGSPPPSSPPSSVFQALSKPLTFRRLCRISADAPNTYLKDLWGEAGPPLTVRSESNSKIKASGEIALMNEEEEDSMTDLLAIPSLAPDSTSVLINETLEQDITHKTAVVWKLKSGLRSGMAEKLKLKNKWDKRRIVLTDTQLLYYSTDFQNSEREQQNDALSAAGETENSSLSGPSPTKKWSQSQAKQWFSKKPQQRGMKIDSSAPRGELDLLGPPPSLQVASPKSNHISNDENNNTSTNPMTMVEICPMGAGDPTPFSILVSSLTDQTKWKFCFDSEHLQLEWLEVLQMVIGIDPSSQGGTKCNNDHSFEPGDHIIRWEMLPIVYPIQIHGIVLEAGKNCVIIADFGLTGYGRKEESDLASDALQESTDNKSNAQKQQHSPDSLVLEAWKKLRPSEKQRLNVIALTDQREIKKWTKVNYGKNLFTGNKSSKKWNKWFRKGNEEEEELFHSTITESDELEEAHQHLLAWREQQEEYQDRPENVVLFPREIFYHKEGNDNTDLHHINRREGKGQTGTMINELQDPDWWHCSFRDATGNDDNNSKEQNNCEEKQNELIDCTEQEQSSAPNAARPLVFSLDDLDPEGAKLAREEKDNENKLPKSDPRNIVLARTNFLLEFGEEVLPPYHVFHSNSECIAVWCKTGRWSTLQTSIFLHSTAVGNAKSATMITMGVAAGHVFLLPVMAVGGIVAVSAPWILLKKSKHMWEEATTSLTDKFWAWAEPDVFVEAIDNWSNVH